MTIEDFRARAGLCGNCRHAIIRPTRRDTIYLRCTLAASDARYPKYPALPMQASDGHEPGAAKG